MKSNYYLLGEAGCAVAINPGDPRGSLEQLKALGWTSERVPLIHGRYDHITGLEALRNRRPGVRVAATAACSADLGDIRLDVARRAEVCLASRGKSGVSYSLFVCRLADEIYEHVQEYVWRRRRLHVMALPGHTSGSVGIFLDGDTFFSGDYLVPGEEVILRLPGGSETDYRTVMEPVLWRLPPGLHICPGYREPYILRGKG